MDISILVNLILLMFETKPGVVGMKGDQLQSYISEPFMFLGDLASMFQMQIYFLQVMQYTNERR